MNTITIEELEQLKDGEGQIVDIRPQDSTKEEPFLAQSAFQWKYLKSDIHVCGRISRYTCCVTPASEAWIMRSSWRSRDMGM